MGDKKVGIGTGNVIFICEKCRVNVVQLFTSSRISVILGRGIML